MGSPRKIRRDIGTRVVKTDRPTHSSKQDNPNWPNIVEVRPKMPTTLEFDYGVELALRSRFASSILPTWAGRIPTAKMESF